MDLSHLGPIEKKIHISWKNKEVLHSTCNIIQHGIVQLKELNPEYEFILYDDEEVEVYLQQLPKEDYERIQGRPMVEKIDLWRLLILYHEGGLYQDIDRLCNVSLHTILTPTTKCLLPTYYDIDFSQDIMCSSSKNPLFLRAIELNLIRRRHSTDIMYLGPHTYFHAVTEMILGHSLERDPGPDAMNLLRQRIQECPYVQTFREEPPFHTILYQGPTIVFDKERLYQSEGVKHWLTL